MKLDPAMRLNDIMSRGLLLNGQIEHNDEVTCVDYHCGLKLIASGDSSGLIKIWNYRRVIVREILFTEPIAAVSFLNACGDLIVGHKGKLSRILAKDYLPHKSHYEVPLSKTKTPAEQYATILDEN